MTAGTVIFLNGTSSSGKSSLVKALQDVLDEPFLDAGIDKFIWMLPERYLDRPLWDDVLGLANRAGPVGHQLVRSMHRAIRALVTNGSHVIADHVLVERDWLLDCASLFADLPAFLIAVRCPLDTLEKRERMRANRTLGQARAQFDLVHAHAAYDFEVDTSLDDPAECARKIVSRIRLGGPPKALKQLRTQPL